MADLGLSSELNELRHVFWPQEERHFRLRARLLVLLITSLIIDAASWALIMLFENGQTLGQWVPALEWSTSQLLVGGSSYNVETGAGHALEVAAHLLGVTVVAAVAGAFASFFSSPGRPE